MSTIGGHLTHCLLNQPPGWLSLPSISSRPHYLSKCLTPTMPDRFALKCSYPLYPPKKLLTYLMVPLKYSLFVGLFGILSKMNCSFACVTIALFISVVVIDEFFPQDKLLKSRSVSYSSLYH